MRLRSLELPGFGCLSRFRCELAPGLNLFYGDNEAGKSTLQQAICAMLYGLYENDRARPDETARHERLRPWDGGVFRGALAYELEDGSSFEVRRDFSTPDVITQVIDSTLGTDVSAQFGRGRHGNIPFARKHLGMSRGVFQSCAFISQGEIFDLDKNASPGQIGDAIAALADSARRDVSAARAIAKLDAAAGKIGSDRARTADLPVARDNLRRANEELAAADDARHSVAEKARQLDGLRAKTAQLAEQALRAEYAYHVAEAARLRDQLRKLDEAELLLARASARAEELREYATLPNGLRDEVLALRAQLKRANDALARVRDTRASVASKLTDDSRLEYEALRVSAGALTEPQIRVLEAIAYSVGKDPRPDIHNVDQGQRPYKAGPWATVARLLAAVARSVGRLLSRLFRRTPSAQPERVEGPANEPAERVEAAPSVNQPEAIALLEKHRRYLTLRPLIEEAARLDNQIEAEAASAAFLEAQLRSLLRTARIEDADIDAALAAFEIACQKRAQCEKAGAAAEEAERRRSLLLAGRTRADIAGLLGERDAEAQRLLRAHPKLEKCQTNSPPEQLSRAAQAARTQQHASEVAATRLEEDVRLTLDRFRPRAEIEEEIARWQGEVDRLERARAAVALARKTIEEAMASVYRDFAPAVNTFLSEGIAAATDGRYQRAHVDPSTLRVSLLVPETGQVLTDPPVSHGTRTLLYVLMRIGLAQHMSAIGEPVPLVLDDPFVDVDSARLRRMLDFLLGLSRRMQVLIFTKDREILSWFREHAVGETHQLHIMSGALAVTSL